MEDSRERIAKEILEPRAEDGASLNLSWEMAVQVAGRLVELGYTDQPEPLADKFRQAIKDARAGKPLDLMEDEFELFSAIENLGVEQAKSPEKFELTELREKLARFHWQECYKSDEHKSFDDDLPYVKGKCYSYADDTLSLFEPVELEALGDEELRMADSNLGDDFYDADDNEAWLIDRRNISQTTIRSNQEKFGPLYRVKDSSGGKNSRKV